jgi:hypothetical protein
LRLTVKVGVMLIALRSQSPSPCSRLAGQPLPLAVAILSLSCIWCISQLKFYRFPQVVILICVDRRSSADKIFGCGSLCALAALREAPFTTGFCKSSRAGFQVGCGAVEKTRKTCFSRERL